MIEPFYGTLRPADKASGAAQIYHISNETGTGKLTVCPVFAGVELCYNDMHLAWCNQDQQAARNVIEINHCRWAATSAALARTAAATWRQRRAFRPRR